MNPTQTPAHSDPTPADVLRRAAEHIERRGFNQGTYYSDLTSEHPAACADGAIRIAAYGEPVSTLSRHDPQHADYSAAFDWLSDYVHANVGTFEGYPIGVQAWNDSPATTGADVVDTLRAAADAWDADNSGGDPS